MHRTSGRIYKIVYDGASPSIRQSGDLRNWAQPALVAAHLQTNDWYTRQARLELSRRARHGMDLAVAAGGLRSAFESALKESQQVQTLLTLHVIGAADDEFLRQQLAHPSEYVRAWAVRMLTETWTLDDALGPAWVTQPRADQIRRDSGFLLPALQRMARTDSSAHVRLTLASVLQRLPVESRAALASTLVAHAEDAEDHNLPLMIWYGLIGVAEVDCRQLLQVARACRLPITLRLISRCIAEEIENHPAAINELLRIATERQESYRSVVLRGVAEGLKGWRQAPKPAAWDKLAGLDSAATADLVRELSVVFGDGRAIRELKAVAMDKQGSEPAARLAALETLIQSKPDDLRSICESLLADQHMNVLAARGLSQFDDPAIGDAIVRRLCKLPRSRSSTRSCRSWFPGDPSLPPCSPRCKVARFPGATCQPTRFDRFTASVTPNSARWLARSGRSPRDTGG